jgi:hypothetical protein
MTEMKFIGKEPVTIIGHGHFLPRKEAYPLADSLAAELIAAKDPNWEEGKAKSNQSEDNHPGTPGEGSPRKGRK